MGGPEQESGHDFDLMAAVTGQEDRRPVKLEFTRKEDFVAVHGRWPTRNITKSALRTTAPHRDSAQGHQRLGAYRKGRGDISAIEVYQCPNVEQSTSYAYTNMAVSANYRAPAYPQTCFALESVMDDIAHKVKMDRSNSASRT
jgi:xanthine dehydrogenase molybdenum-binding subunit